MSHSSTYSIVSPEPGTKEIHLLGCWKIDCPTPPFSEIFQEVDSTCKKISIRTDALTNWDSLLIVFLTQLVELCGQHGIETDLSQIPDGAGQLLHLADTGREKDIVPATQPSGLRAGIGQAAMRLFASGRDMATFTGDIIIELIRIMRGKSYFRTRDFFYFIQNCGAQALPIVSLISILVGVILGFVGAIQLGMFGAQIYVADLVAVAMVLEMGAMMSGVIMAGRTGAAYAAQLGTMQVSEEIDALQTMGISPVGFLVLPRMLALILMMPLLCVYADLLGIIGGTFIGVTMLDISPIEYLRQTRQAITLDQCSQGVIKSVVYGVLVGFSGCYQGMRCGRSASAVGESTTKAVVMGIVLIVVSDAIMTMLFNFFKIGV